MRRRRLIVGGVACLGLSSPGCSTVDRGPIAECQDDADCTFGLVCSLAQGLGNCVPEVLPPRTVLGFDIAEGNSLRVELNGCDPEVTRELGGSELRVQKRSSLVQVHQLRSSESRSVVNCGGNECAGVCDEQALTCTEQADSSLRFSTISRLGLADIVSPSGDYLANTEMPLDPPSPVPITWPSYETTTDIKARSAVRLEVVPVAPEGESSLRSPYYRAIAPDADLELDSAGLGRCERAIIGSMGTVGILGGAVVEGADIEFTYNEAIATPQTVIGTPPPCVEGEDEDSCPPGWACNDGQCGLDLTGVRAGSAKSDVDGRVPQAQLYTYCEGIISTLDDPLVRQLRVRVAPPPESGLPTMIYDLAQEFPDPTQPGLLDEVNLPGGLCLPNWQAPFSVGFSLLGSPVALTETDLGVYECCSTECLPSTETDVEPTPPPSIESCQSFASVSFETRWFNQDPVEWSFAGCIDTAANSDGSSGTYSYSVSACEEDGCAAMLTMGAVEDENRNYTVTIEQPNESVFRSDRFNVSITPETTELPTFELKPRVLLRGQIVCATTGCSAENAVIAAERLHAEDGDETLPGPFLFYTRVDAEGNFVLPVDPGLYVITAYPAVGQPGGPAPFEILDLREDSPMLEDVDGVPHANLSSPLELDDGVLVRVQLRDFAVSTGVTPIDTGSWTYQSNLPEGVDLNDPETCLGKEVRGCQIRRILPPTAAPIPILVSGSFQFTTRDRGSDACPE